MHPCKLSRASRNSRINCFQHIVLMVVNFKPRMTAVLQKYFNSGEEPRIYIEKTYKGPQEEYLPTLKKSKTIYVTNIPENIKEERLWHLFSMVGSVKRVIMGVNKSHLTFCGFCFVEFDELASADDSIVFFKDYLLDGKFLRIDKDIGYSETRQFGRGAFGGTLRGDSKKRRR